MLKGIEYALSPEKRAFDKVVNRVLIAPSYRGILRVIEHKTGMMPEVSQHPRVGQDSRVFMMHKIVIPGHSDPLLKRLAEADVDELGQAINIGACEMSVCGRRALDPSEHRIFIDTLHDRRRAIYVARVMPTRPGIFSTFAIEAHSNIPGSPEERVELDERDVVDGCLKRDMQVVAQVFGTTVVKRIFE